MNGSDDNMVVIRRGTQQGEPSVISINCLDQPGLACDLTRVLFEFSLHVVKGDLSKDGQWCLVIFWVIPRDQTFESIKWPVLKKHLVSACPPTRSRLLVPLLSEPKPNKGLYILQTWSSDRLGLLNDIASILWNLEVVVQKMKASTSPENRAVNIFYIFDTREMLHEKQRQELLCRSLKAILGEDNASCKVMAAGPEWGGLECSPLSVPWTFTSISSLDGKNGDLESAIFTASALTGFSQSTSITLDNSLSPAHTLLQISCKDRRGLVYDCMRTLKEFQIQVAFGRLSINSKGYGDIDLFVLEADGGKILDPDRQKLLSCRLELEIMQPLNVLTWSRGPDTELLVATPIELNGRGRPKVLCDTTLQFRKLGLDIFQKRIAIRVLSQDCSAGPCERNWSTWALFHTKKRNKLKTAQLERLVFCHCNLQLLEKSAMSPEPSQVNVDNIDIEKTRNIPDIPLEERDIYSLLYEELSAPSHDTRRQRRSRASTSLIAEREIATSSSSSQSRESSDEEVEDDA